MSLVWQGTHTHREREREREREGERAARSTATGVPFPAPEIEKDQFCNPAWESIMVACATHRLDGDVVRLFCVQI